MKYVLLSMVCLFFSLAGMAQEEGVRFENLTLEQALAKAKAENKLVFMDCYTSWCGPCKRMMNTVFPQKKVGDYMNAKFVNLKCDMEKGEGPELMKKYGVGVFPTYLMIHPDGSLAHKFKGAMSASDFLEGVKESFDADKAFGTLEKRYVDGDRGKEFLSNYVEALIACSDPRSVAVSHELFKLLSSEERFSERYRYIYQRVDYFPVGSPEWKFFVENQERFDELLGEEMVRRLMFVNYNFILNGVFVDPERVEPAKKLKQMEKELKKLPLEGENLKVLEVYLKVAQAKATGDMEKFVTVCEQELPKISKARVPVKAFERYNDKLSPELKERWDKLAEQLRNGK